MHGQQNVEKYGPVGKPSPSDDCVSDLNDGCALWVHSLWPNKILGLCTVVQCKPLPVYWQELRCMNARRSILLSSVLDIPWTCFKSSLASSDSGKLSVHGEVRKGGFGGISLVEIGNCCVFAGFRRELAENRALLGYYAASSGNFLPTFRDNLSVPSSKVKNPFGFLKRQ